MTDCLPAGRGVHIEVFSKELPWRTKGLGKWSLIMGLIYWSKKISLCLIVVIFLFGERYFYLVLLWIWSLSMCVYKIWSTLRKRLETPAINFGFDLWPCIIGADVLKTIISLTMHGTAGLSHRVQRNIPKFNLAKNQFSPHAEPSQSRFKSL